MHGLSALLNPSSKDDDALTMFELGIDNERTIFLPGQSLDGQISLSLSSPVEVTLLRIRFTGFISTHNYKSESLNENNSTATLFKDLQTCVGGLTDDNPVLLEAGDYVYPFSFRFPALALPPTYDGVYGTVRYEVGAVLVRPNKFNKTASIQLSVPSTLDSGNVLYNDPVEQVVKKNVGVWWWNKGHVEVKASIPRKAFPSEDILPLTIEITNQSNSSLELSSVYLKQRSSCRTTEDSKGPRTEKIHKLNFSETYLPELKHIVRQIQFPIPETSIFSPSIKTAILEVFHILVIKVKIKSNLPSNDVYNCGLDETCNQKKIKKKRFSYFSSSNQNLSKFSDKSSINSSHGEGSQRSSSIVELQKYRANSNQHLKRSKSLNFIIGNNTNSIVEFSSFSNLKRRHSLPITKVNSLRSELNILSDANFQPENLILPRISLFEVSSINPSVITNSSNRHSHFITSSNVDVNSSTSGSHEKNSNKRNSTTIMANSNFKKLLKIERTVKLELPVIIGGFPHVLMDVQRRRSIDTLPLYFNEECDKIVSNNSNNTNYDSETIPQIFVSDENLKVEDVASVRLNTCSSEDTINANDCIPHISSSMSFTQCKTNDLAEEDFDEEIYTDALEEIPLDKCSLIEVT
ncbi:hypothetical protein HDU92_002166 [Lobulomyces angularis]|nr:hypothetical protein HDU92_002166 [Lobulomyces angularis]